ncbi:MAG TPA: class I SAM-dependent methyltransferase [bacterium]|nr:class I SAM-dependent methyltransferase [bacterium]
MAYIDFLSKIHKSTKRDYLERVCKHDKVECSERAVKFGYDYWDGDRSTGYGGYKYDGRWRTVAEEMVKHYGLGPESRILDVGCGKGFLLYDFTQVIPGCTVAGIDISGYAIENAKEEIKPFIQTANAAKLPFEDKSFDFVYSINVLHNLYIHDLWSALKEKERVCSGNSYLVVETYRNEREKVNLMYWQLTCRAFHTPEEWEWIFDQTGYKGDHSFITFE